METQPGFEQRVRPHAWLNAKIIHDARFPVVFLEHGSGVVPALYTVLAGGLASEGYIVVATRSNSCLVIDRLGIEPTPLKPGCTRYDIQLTEGTWYRKGRLVETIAL